MSPDSNTSSVDAQNGSTYRYYLSLQCQKQSADATSSQSHADSPFQESCTGSTNPTDHTTEAQYPVDIPYDHAAVTATQPAQDTRAITNDYAINYNEGYSYTNGDYSKSTSSYDIFPRSEQQSEFQWNGNGYQQYQQYYLPPTSYPQETPKYDPELVIDSIEEERDSSRFPNQPQQGRARHRPEDAATSDRSPHRASSQQNSQTTNVAHTPTARRWSREYSPGERMRVGLPRWETEQHRMDYERQQR
jgi:hypothetical protein